MLGLSHQGKVHCLVFLLAFSTSVDRRPGCADFCPQIFTNLRFCAQLCTQLPLVPVSVVPPLPSRLSHYTQPRRPHKTRRFARFTVLRRIDRLEHSPSATRHLQIWSLRFVYIQIVLRLPLLDAVLDRSETKFVGGVLPGRADAAVHALSLRRSISCRLWSMLQRLSVTSALPPADFHDTTVPSDRQTGWKRKTRRVRFGHAQHSTGKCKRA